MNRESAPQIRGLIERLDAAVGLDQPDRITGRIKIDLEQLTRGSGVTVPEAFKRAGTDRYARRLLHRAPNGGYTVVVMAWGPGQRTQLHDHGGLWCVECVLQGEIDVTQYDLIEREADRFRFERQPSVRATMGDAGCLIPPFDYHVLQNALPDRTSISLHVYAGEMSHCNLFEPEGPRWWTRTSKSLHYDP